MYPLPGALPDVCYTGVGFNVPHETSFDLAGQQILLGEAEKRRIYSIARASYKN